MNAPVTSPQCAGAFASVALLLWSLALKLSTAMQDQTP
jgi:hypothetical protein